MHYLCREFVDALGCSVRHGLPAHLGFSRRLRSGLISIALLATIGWSMSAAEPLTEQQQKYLKQAEAGDAWAQYEVGLFTEDDAKASEWFLRSAKQENEFAMAIIGARYLRGTGVAKDEVEGARWQLKAFEANPGLVRDYGVDIGELDSSINDRYVARHGSPELRALFASAKQGEPAAMTDLARRLLNWNGVLQDRSRAKQLLLDAVAKDHTPAFALLGDFLCEFDQDTEAASKLYLQAAQRGAAEAQFSLAFLFETGDGGHPQDEAAAKDWYRKAAEAGYGPALLKQAELAFAANDLSTAEMWAKKADQANMDRAGVLLEEIATAKAEAAIEAQIPPGLDDEQRQWMRNAIAGDPEYQFYVGRAFCSLKNFPNDTAQMLKWLTLSAEAGNWQAQAELGILYHYGTRGVTADRATAEKWLLRAAESGEAEAVFRLGRFYADEPAQQTLAREWLAKAGSSEASALLAHMDREGKKVAAAQSIAAAATAFQHTMQASTSPAQREKAVEAFSRVVSSNYYEAGMTRPDAEDLVLKTMLPFLEQRPDEAYRQVAGIANTVFSKDAVSRVLPASLGDAIRAQAERVVAEYHAEQKRWDEIRALSSKAEAGDVGAMAALAAAYLTAPGGIEKNWESAMIWVNKVRARNSDAANATHNQVSAYVNQRSESLLKGEDLSAAIGFLEKLAGHFEFDAANCHRLGALHASPKKGHTPDYAKAIPWFERAASLGSLESMLALGRLHVVFENHPLDEGVALKWFQQAAAKENVVAQQWVELLQSSGDATARAALAKKIVDDQRHAKAREQPPGPNQIDEWDLLRYASQLGNGDAMARLGVDYFIATVDPGKIAAGLKWLKRAEAAGSVRGLRSLGHVYLRGVGVPKDVPLGLDYLARATELGDANAAEAIGQHWSEQRDWDKAEKAWLRAAMMGSVTAKARLAELAEDGTHRPQNLAEAIRLWEEIAAGEDSYRGYAMYRLGLMHREGRGVPKDETKALEWIRKGAEVGWPEAKREWEKTNGAGASSAPTLASDEAAAANGDAGAMYRLGLRHLKGDGVAKDEARARAWLEKAAALGHEDADFELAELEAAEIGELGAEVIAGQLSEMKRQIDAAAAAGPQPGVTIIKIPGADQNITAVRYFGGWYVAIGSATKVDGLLKSKVWFSRDARAWELRFTASSPVEDVAYARSPLGDESTFLLVLPRDTRLHTQGEPTTWCFRVADNAWSEVRGLGARETVATVGTKFVLSGQRTEGSSTVETVSVSWVPTDWPAKDVFAQFKDTRPPPRWHDRQMFEGRVYRSSSHSSATWAIRSSDDLQNWTDECLIPAPAAGKEHETEPHLCASDEMLLVGTMVAMGDGPVRFYRKQAPAGAWERITPNPSWNYLHGLSYAGGRFVAVASREDLRVSKDGLRWKVVANVRPYSPRFAVSPEGSYVFGGLEGAIAIVTPDKSWDDFSTVAEPTMQTGANWEKETTSKTADTLFSLARTFGAKGPNEDAQQFLRQAVAVAETGSPETRLRLGMILFEGALGIPKDVTRGIALVASAAEAGSAMARLTYGMALINGANGLVPIDAAKGTELLQAAVRDADTADAEAKFQIVALLLQGGPGIPADRKRAFELLGVAADGGFPPAQFNYAQALLTGTPEVTADIPRGVEMLKNAANQKVPQAAALLGQIYESGQGVSADLKEAKGWYALAVNLGFRQAAPALQRVEAKLKTSGAP